MKNKQHKFARRMALVVLSLVVLSGALGIEATAETSASLSKKELKTLLTTAKTPADHQRITAYYRSKSQRLTAKALEFSAEADRLATQPATVESKQGISCNCRESLSLLVEAICSGGQGVRGIGGATRGALVRPTKQNPAQK